MERKNTLLLTVIAVATLLVAVVGATFAYFTATSTGSDASEITTTTTSVDTVTSQNDHLTLTVTLADMLEVNGMDDGSVSKSESGTVGITVAPGSDLAERTCTYDIVYTPEVNGDFTPTVGAARDEYTIQATATINGTTDGTKAISETSLEGTAPITLVNDASFTYSNSSVALLYNFTVKFYNLAIDQSIQAGETFDGNIQIVDLTCVAAP